MTINAYTDGASRGNPGESGIGIILRDEKGNLLHSFGGYIGRATNNIAEYKALLACLKKARETPCTKLVVHSDSELLVRQLQGKYRVRNKNLQKYYLLVRRLIEDAPFAVEFLHIDRERNHEADLLANAGIDSRRRLAV